LNRRKNEAAWKGLPRSFFGAFSGIFFGAVYGVGLFRFVGILEGVLGNCAVRAWFFDGQNVVFCVVNVVLGHALFRL
jgi:hypothetical protein